MRSLRRARLALVAGVRVSIGVTLLTGGLLAVSQGAASAATCTKTYSGPVTGTANLWTTAGNWTPSGAPGASDDVCITANGTYTVELDGSASVNSVSVGGTTGTATLRVLGSASGNATLTIAAASKTAAHGAVMLDSDNGNFAMLTGAGAFTNNGKLQLVQGAGGGIRYLRAPITNAASGTVSITSTDVRQDTGTLDTNNGTWTLSATAIALLNATSSFTQTAGTLTNSGSLTVSGGGTFTESGGSESGNPVVVSGSTLADSAGTGAFQVVGSSVVTGTIPSGQTVTLLGSPAGNASISLNGATLTNNGTLSMDSTNGDFSMITNGALTNNATFTLVDGAGGGIRYLRAPITNAASGTVSITSTDVRQDTGTLDTNNGSWTLSAAAIALLNSGSSFTQAAGTLTNHGSLTISGGGTFTQSGGSESANPVVVSGSTLADSAGHGSFQVVGSSILTGTIPVGQTVTLLGSPAGNATISLNSATLTNNGTLNMDSNNGDYSMITTGALTNNATFNVVDGSGAGTRYLRAPITNSATGTVSITSTDVRQDLATLDTNNGALTLSAAAVVSLTGGSSFTQAAGTLTNNGSLTVSGGGTFTESGGSESANPVVVSGSTLADSAGTGAFQVVGNSAVTGTIPAGQTVTLLGSAAGNAAISLNGATLTNNGTLNMDSTNGDYSLLQSGALTNAGNLNVVQGSGGTRYLRVPITNTGSGNVSITSTDVRQDQATANVNNGSWILGDGALVTQGGGSSITTGANGTLGFTVHAPSAVSRITGGAVTLGGRLKVNTTGSPTVGTVFTPVTGATVSGSFASLEFGPNAYTVGTTATTVTLTTGTPFSMTAKALSLVQMTPVKVTVATVSDPTPASGYTVTIDWGDSTQSAGSFSLNGSGGTAKGAHAYALAGSYTVTTTIHGTDGTTITKAKTATVTAAPVPTVTAVTPNALGRSASTTLTLTGTGFTSNSVVSFSATGITVTSTTWSSPTSLKVKVKTAASTTLGVGNVTVTTPGGSGTCTGCLTIDAAPKITNIAPNPVHGTSTNVTVTGTGFQAGLTVTSTITGATLGAPTGVTATSFSILITVPAGTAAGPYKLSVTNPDFGKVTAPITVS